MRPEWLQCDHLHVSGYALLAHPVAEAATRAVELARGAGARISVDLSSWSTIRDAGAEGFRALVESLEPDVVFANEDEDRVFAEALRRVAWILKHGAHGCSFDGATSVLHCPWPRSSTPTGAGMRWRRAGSSAGQTSR